MVREFENKKEWALILGGSSGLGLASAEKLAKHGMNLIIVYRASRAQLSEIIERFESIKQTHSVELMHFNSDIAKVLDAFASKKKQTASSKDSSAAEAAAAPPTPPARPCPPCHRACG